jgi:Family of unknown function (DUF5675)
MKKFYKESEMQLILQRLIQSKRSTIGRLTVNGQIFSTLEPPPVPNPPPDGNNYVCIPAETYPLTIRWSPKFNRQVPHVENVPGRTAIELHIGNFPDDTDGCGLIGVNAAVSQPDYISQSSVSFAKLLTILYDGSTLTNPGVEEKFQIWEVGSITYVDPV